MADTKEFEFTNGTKATATKLEAKDLTVGQALALESEDIRAAIDLMTFVTGESEEFIHAISVEEMQNVLTWAGSVE